MRIVVSGTHASGKSTLISDLVAARPEYTALADPFESIDELDPTGALSFVAQLRVSSVRLLELAPGSSVVVERGPLDALAYLLALGELGRADTTAAVRSGVAMAARAMARVDLIAITPPETSAVGPDEDPELRELMGQLLLELIDDNELTGGARICELFGAPADRLSELLRQVDEGPEPTATHHPKV